MLGFQEFGQIVKGYLKMGQQSCMVHNLVTSGSMALPNTTIRIGSYLSGAIQMKVLLLLLLMMIQGPFHPSWAQPGF
jgi:hypothetical protein